MPSRSDFDTVLTKVTANCRYREPPDPQRGAPQTPPALPPSSEPRTNRLSEELFQIHHQKRHVNHGFGGLRQLGHQTA